MALQYPLLFLYGEDGFHEKIAYNSNAGTPLLRGSRLFQQYLVDAFAAVEEQRLKWIRNNKDTLRVDLYHNVCDAVTRGDTSATGLRKRIVLPRNFIDDLTKNKIFEDHAAGNTHQTIRPGLAARTYSPMAREHSKCKTPNQIDDIISTELPYPTHDPASYKAIAEFMLHGPCAKDASYAPCTTEGKCSKHFPKAFLPETVIHKDGYPIYHRMDDKVTTIKGPDRATIIKHENVKTGVDGTSEQVLEVDEIKNYLNCQFLALCEAALRLFLFDIHYSYPPVMQLNYHLPNQNAITLQDSKNLPTLLEREGINVTIFTQWFELNKLIEEQRRNYCLLEIQELLNRHGREALAFDVNKSRVEHEELHSLLNPEQRLIYEQMIESASHPCSYRGAAHSRFVIPLELMENNTCGIKQNTHLAELMQQVRMIIWNEAPMTQKRDGIATSQKKEAEDEPTWIEIPEEFLIKSWNSLIEQIVSDTYPNFTTRQTNDEYLKEMAILTLWNDDADAVNEYMFKKLGGAAMT
ncbi:ATP-dependent DNA helicase PIF1 [Tanacetum coccineum]|uniref:ATP-dependent DNA helicase n=1 Tax=Tanacetum coccineum TaxID=301880 RepID=A0ABQ4Y9H5_9ASTR